MQPMGCGSTECANAVKGLDCYRKDIEIIAQSLYGLEIPVIEKIKEDKS